MSAAHDARAERRARQLLGEAAGAEALAMYDELGFLVTESGRGYGYAIYPQRSIVSFDSASGELLSEYCVRFPDTVPEDDGRLPDADDVLAKWMALHGDERRLLVEANMHLPGKQLDPGMVRGDLARAIAWRARRAGHAAAAEGQPARAAQDVAA